MAGGGKNAATEGKRRDVARDAGNGGGTTASAEPKTSWCDFRFQDLTEGR